MEPEPRRQGLLVFKQASPLVVNLFILLYGASFTLVMTVYQTFATAGLQTVRAGIAALRESGWADPSGYKTVAAGCYAGGLAVMTVLRDETAAAVAIGVDTGNRVAATLEATFAAPAEEEFTSLKSPPSPGGEVPSIEAVAAKGKWRATVRHGFWVAFFVLLALTFQKTTRVASICVLAAQVIVERGAPLLTPWLVRANPNPNPNPSPNQVIVDRGAPLLTPLLGRSAATGIADKGSNSHLAAVAAVAGMGLLVQFLLYVRPPNAWALPNGSAMPVLFRAVAAAPLAAEDALEAVKNACTCDARKLRAVASHTVHSFARNLS